jgi:hypothetical protein
MSVTFGGSYVGMTKKGLDIANVGAAFEQVGSKGMAKAVDRDFFMNSGSAESFIKNMLG